MASRHALSRGSQAIWTSRLLSARVSDGSWRMFHVAAAAATRGAADAASANGPSTSTSSAPSARPPVLSPGLYVVATPIGNLHDLSPRAAAVLTAADAVLCEDTRHSAPLLARAAALHAALSSGGLAPGLPASATPRPTLVSLHAHNEAARTDAVLGRLAAGQAVALVSDAGTPLVSDPGGAVVAAAAAAGHTITPVPGPCAAIAAVSAAGLDAGDFLFLGFLPAKPGARRAALQRVKGVPAALVAYSPARSLAALLADAAAVLGPDRRVAVGREITKKHEEWWRGGLGEGAAVFKGRGADVRGEVSLVVERPDGDGGGAGPPSVDASAALISLLEDGVPPSAAARALAKALGVGRADLYAQATRWKHDGGGQ